MRTKERPESTRATQRTRCVRGGGCPPSLARAKNQKASKKTRKGSKRDTREGPCILLARLSLGETRDYSQPFSQNNSSHSSRLLRRALAAESNCFGHYIFAHILTLSLFCPIPGIHSKYRLLPLHSQIPREDQRRVFEPVPPGVTKVDNEALLSLCTDLGLKVRLKIGCHATPS